MNIFDRAMHDFLREFGDRISTEPGRLLKLSDTQSAGADAQAPVPPVILPDCPVCKGKAKVTGVFPWIDPWHERTIDCEHCNGTGVKR